MLMVDGSSVVGTEDLVRTLIFKCIRPIVSLFKVIFLQVLKETVKRSRPI